ncbi:FAD:protein FMN transferase [Paraconexibacter antarcticus]|uniref:FAD:protein FMN transferase n=1 Tax=Paraconexibacter antarcticus TaxID=2949664 RepID=A0ABY5DMZ6_9ACTN|nr:FAD:protein FMN transferase [Paraconexibacter antarcticus]UTI62959.1 FAD:protein FMN transferase [Paraconexibacter antarcticus]
MSRAATTGRPVTGDAAWRALGTGVRLLVTDAAALPPARSAVEAELAATDLVCSRFRPDAELVRLNARAGREVRVSARLLDAVTLALRAAALTEGAVDPTVGAALVAAGYDRDFPLLAAGGAPGRGRRADRLRLRLRHRAADWRSVRVDPAASTVRVPSGVRLDLGATAKAACADRAAAAARDAAAAVVAHAGVLVSLGGDVAVAGPAPAGGWRVLLAEDHAASPSAGAPAVTVTGGGLASSSTTVRRWGDGAHHLIDPRTGRPAAGPWRTATVAAGSCADANIASTAALVLGEDAVAWLAGRDLPARLVGTHGRVLAVGGWPEDAS